MFKPKKAFTLIELLVVIAIIGILATISVIALQNARAKSRDAKRIADVKQVQTALELYFNDMNRYPLTEEFAGAISSTSSSGTSTYMTRIPAAPTPADGSCSDSDNYFYYTSDDGSTYTLSFCIGGNTGSLSAGLNTLSPGGIAYSGAGSGGTGGSVCSCDRSSLPCCRNCNPANAVCQGGTYCARDANCPIGQGCSTGGTCVGFVCGNTVTVGTVGSHVCNEGSPDNDECHYETVKIGDQCWMKQNIRMAMPGRMFFAWTWSYALTYGDLYYWPGAMQIPQKCFDDTYDCTTDPTVCDSSDNDCDFSLVNPQGVCPAGWHVPTKTDWYTLETALGGYAVAGGKLKASATTTPTAWDGNNSSGFSALPTGLLVWNGYWERVGWWTANWSSFPHWGLSLQSSDSASSVGSLWANTYTGLPVRCIQN